MEPPPPPPSWGDFKVFFFLWQCKYEFFFRNKRNLKYTLPGGSTPIYKPYSYVPPHRVGFLRRFGLKTGIHFAHFGLESGMGFEGTTGVYERIYRFNFK